MKGRVAKYYLTDGRRHTDSEGYKTSVAFEKYLADCGLQVATDRDFGITALRWAGMKAGIGIIRKNNFFYTEKGSYQYLEAFLMMSRFSTLWRIRSDHALRNVTCACDPVRQNHWKRRT